MLSLSSSSPGVLTGPCLPGLPPCHGLARPCCSTLAVSVHLEGLEQKVGTPISSPTRGLGEAALPLPLLPLLAGASGARGPQLLAGSCTKSPSPSATEQTFRQEKQQQQAPAASGTGSALAPEPLLPLVEAVGQQQGEAAGREAGAGRASPPQLPAWADPTGAADPGELAGSHVAGEASEEQHDIDTSLL